MARWVHYTTPYIHLVQNAADYPFCSFRWFVERAEEKFRQQVLAQPCDRVHVKDDFGGQ